MGTCIRGSENPFLKEVLREEADWLKDFENVYLPFLYSKDNEWKEKLKETTEN